MKNLRPAIISGGKTHIGEFGQHHDDMGLKGQRGFVTPEGQFLPRFKASGWVKKNQPEVFAALTGKGEYSLHTGDYNKAVMSLRKEEPDRGAVDLSKKTICIIDYGQYSYLAEDLAAQYKDVLYYVPTYDWCPMPDKVKIGTGLKGVTRVLTDTDFWNLVHVEPSKEDKVDLFAFFWIGFAGLQRHITSLGYRTYGPMGSDILECDKWLFNETLKKVGLPAANMVKVKGVPALRKHIEGHPDTYVKISYYRGVVETFAGCFLDEIIDDICNEVGPYKDEMEFIIQDKIESAVEVGYDGWCVNGERPKKTMFGPEVKDALYIGMIVDEPPAIAHHVNEMMAPEFKRLGYNGSMHTEIRIEDAEYSGDFKGKPHFIDLTARPGSPPMQTMSVMYRESMGRIIWDCADGVLPDPKPEAKYAGELLLKSPWHKKHAIKITFPKELEPWIRIKNHYIQDGEHWSGPMAQDDIIGSITAIGKTMEEVCELLCERVADVKAYQLEYDLHAIEEAKEVIEKMADFGIPFK
jgi:hypothetical protein